MSDVRNPLNWYWDKGCPYAFVARVPLNEDVMQNIAIYKAPAQRNIRTISKHSKPDNGTRRGEKAINVEFVSIEVTLRVHHFIEVIAIS